jgi:hypothetical protein
MGDLLSTIGGSQTIDLNLNLPCDLAQVTTLAVTSVTQTTAASGGNITDDGGSSITARGVIWSLDNNPTILNNNLTNDGTGTGSFSSTITGLSASTPYFVRAYATNSAGTAYGNVVGFSTEPIKIGDQLEGGIVFYLDATGKHGFVCATADQGNAPWDLTPFDPNNNQLYAPVLVGSSGTAVGTGSSNTGMILSTLGAGSYAASLCSNYDGGGFNDWFLPSIDELTLMYQNLAANGAGNFASSYYWSSSEIDYRAVWSFKFGQPFDGAWKNNPESVRAVRAF